MKLHYFARSACALTTVIIVTGSTYGRSITNSYPIIIDIIPYIASVLALFSIAIAFTSLKTNLKKKSTTIDIGRFITAIALFSLILLVAYAICESMIIYPIERIHFIKYGLFAFLLFFSQQSEDNVSRLVKATIISSLVGAAEESLQILVPDRVFDVRDMLLNLCGAFFGALTSWNLTLWPRAINSK